MIELSDGSKYWYQNRKLHREDGPAIKYADGTKYWYQNGKLHRKNKPAIERANGNKLWYQNGKRHREDGPAIEWSDGTKEWWLNGKQLTEEEFKEKTENKNTISQAKNNKNNIIINKEVCKYANPIRTKFKEELRDINSYAIIKEIPDIDKGLKKVDKYFNIAYENACKRLRKKIITQFREWPICPLYDKPVELKYEVELLEKKVIGNFVCLECQKQK